MLAFQRGRFRAPLASDKQARYDQFLGPLIDDNFRRQPGAGPAFAQPADIRRASTSQKFVQYSLPGAIRPGGRYVGITRMAVYLH